MREEIKEKIWDCFTTTVAFLPLIIVVLLFCFGKWKAALYVLGSLWLLGVGVMYIIYKLMIVSSIILHSAGKMKTGNDLTEQVEDTLKNKNIPNFFQFYWRLILKM